VTNFSQIIAVDCLWKRSSKSRRLYIDLSFIENVDMHLNSSRRQPFNRISGWKTGFEKWLLGPRHNAKLAQMSQALYRKWRPTRFNQVVGQEHITQTLQNAVAADRVGHAYLFSGPRGTGKTTLARLLAKAVNCLDEDLSQRPCDKCQPCLAVNEGRYLDLIEIDAASNTGVDDIRDLRDKINFSPSEGRFKVYIIDEVHMLSTAAFNALLKTLEEPPSHAIFVLATTEEHKVPLTIKSRCQQFNFRLLTTQEIVGRISSIAENEALTVEPEAIALIAQHGSGSLRDAESLLDQLIVAPEDIITLERAQLVLGTASNDSVTALTDAWIVGDGSRGLSIIHDALASGTDARQFSRQMVLYLRHLMLVKTAGHDLIIDAPKETQQLLASQAKRVERRQIIEAVKNFNEAANVSTRSWHPQLPLEMAFIELLPESGRRERYEPKEAILETPASFQPSIKPTEPEINEVINAAEQEPAEIEKLETSKEPSIKDEVEQKKVDSSTISLEMVVGQWPKLRDVVSKQDRSLPALLASCKPLATEGKTIYIGFDFPILKDKFDHKKQAKEIVSRGLSQLLGTDCFVKSVVTSDFTAPNQSEVIDKEYFFEFEEELGGIVRENE
jgi:DNA polymerase-3 subunit gamma/tau